MAQSVTRRIERSLTASAGFRSRPTDKASICGNHQGQRSCEIAPKGRTHDCKRPVLLTKKALASWGPSTHEAASWYIRRYLVGGGLVQCSCAAASDHAEPSGWSISHVSASLPLSMRYDCMPVLLRGSPVFLIRPLERKAEPRAVARKRVIVHDYTYARPLLPLAAISAA